MNRRTLLKTAFGTLLATTLGLAPVVAVNTVEQQKQKSLDDFAEFFIKVNGFPMNVYQMTAYKTYACKSDFYMSPRRMGMTTLLCTMAMYESYIKKQRVVVRTDNVDRMEHIYRILCEDLRNLCIPRGRFTYSLGNVRSIGFIDSGSIIFTCSDLYGKGVDIELINYDQGYNWRKYPIGTHKQFYMGTYEL